MLMRRLSMATTHYSRVMMIHPAAHHRSVFLSSPPKAIAAYVFARYFLFFYFLLVYAMKVAGTVVYPGNLVLGREVTQASAGGCRANPVR